MAQDHRGDALVRFVSGDHLVGTELVGAPSRLLDSKDS